MVIGPWVLELLTYYLYEIDALERFRLVVRALVLILLDVELKPGHILEVRWTCDLLTE